LAHRSSSVSIRQLPQKFDTKGERLFFRELEGSMNVQRPAIVLDCSRMREMDSTSIHFLLCCLEGAMKRNGDVRLCGVAPKALLNLQLAEVDCLFKIFATSEEAVESFLHRIVSAPMRANAESARQMASEPAA
jgi:anti-anti-sigma regulatory factor